MCLSMSLSNNDFIAFDGTPITGRAPTQVQVYADTGYEMSDELRGMVAHTYKLFCDAVKVSAIPLGYHVQNREFEDGSKCRIESNNGVHRVMVWPVGSGGGAGRYSVHPVALFASLESPHGKYVLGGTAYSVSAAFTGEKAGSVWSNAPSALLKPVVFANYPKFVFNPTKLADSVPGNMDWSDRREGGRHFGLVLSWWSLSVGRYATGPFYMYDGDGLYSTLGSNAIYEDYDAAAAIPSAMGVVWCNGIAVAKLPSGMRVLSACLAERDGVGGYLRVIATSETFGSAPCQCYEVRIGNLSGLGKLSTNQRVVDFATSPSVSVLWVASDGVFSDNIGAEVFHANSSGSSVLVCGYTTGLVEVSTLTGGASAPLITPAGLPRLEDTSSYSGNSTLNNNTATLDDVVAYEGSNSTTLVSKARDILAWDYVADTPVYLYSEATYTTVDSMTYSTDWLTYVGECTLTTSGSRTAAFVVKNNAGGVVYSDSATASISGTATYSCELVVDGTEADGTFSDVGSSSISGTQATYKAWVTGDLRVNCFDIHVKSIRSTQTSGESYEVSGASHIWEDTSSVPITVFDPVVGLRAFADASYLEDDCRTTVKVVSGSVVGTAVRHNYSTITGASGSTTAPFDLQGQYGLTPSYSETGSPSSGIVPRVDQGRPSTWADSFPYRMGIRRDSKWEGFGIDHPFGVPRDVSAIGFLPAAGVMVLTYGCNGELGSLSNTSGSVTNDRFGFTLYAENAAHTLGYTSSFDNRLVFRSVLHVDVVRDNLTTADFSAEHEFIRLPSGTTINLTSATPDDFAGETAKGPTGVLLLGPVQDKDGKFTVLPKYLSSEDTP